MARQTRALHVVLDFDGTLTQSDTTAVLGSISTLTGTRPLLSWTDIVTAYLEDYNAHSRSYNPKPNTRTTLYEEIAWLRSLRPMELDSVRRVEEAGVFRAVTSKTIASLATRSIDSGEVALRKGWRDLLRLCSVVPVVQTSILSVNWSSTFVQQILLAAARKEPQSSLASGFQAQLGRIPIYANEIEGLNELGGSRGRLGSDGGIRTSGDKLGCLNSHVVHSCSERVSKVPSQATHHEPGATRQPLMIYVGDSLTDLECLVAADIGICIRDEAMGSGQRELASCLDRLGIDVLPLEDTDLSVISSKARLWWARDLECIAQKLAKL